MRITDIRIKFEPESKERLLGYCSIILDDALAIHDLKIISGTKGLFVAMPSRKLMDRCRCGGKNHLKARICNYCGEELDDNRGPLDEMGKVNLHADIVHPINCHTRNYLQSAILAEYYRLCEEMSSSSTPNEVTPAIC